MLTTGDNVALTATLLDLNDDLKVIGTDLTWATRDFTAGEGPIQVGVSNNQYSAAEIVEALDASPAHRADEIALERSARKVRNVGVFMISNADESLADGRVVRTRKLYWPLAGSANMVIWGVNRSGAALTTGGVIEVQGKVYAKWT